MSGDTGRPRVLVTDDITGQNRAALGAVRALSIGGFDPVVTVTGQHSIAAPSRFCRGRVWVPPAGTSRYPGALRQVLDTGSFVLALPASDAALVALDDPAADLVDKGLLPGRAAGAGLEVLPQESFPDGMALVSEAGRLAYPVIVKPATKGGLGSLQALRVSAPGDLDGYEDYLDELIVQPYEESPLWAMSGVVWDGELRAVAHQRSHRLWPADAGVASAAETIEPKKSFEEGVVRLLDGHQGVFQVQFLGPYLIDVNPRVYGSLPLAVAAGANLPAIAARAALGERTPLARAEVGVRYRWLEGDVRNVRRQVRTGSMSWLDAARTLVPRRQTAYSLESLRDPGPWVSRIRYVAAQSR